MGTIRNPVPNDVDLNSAKSDDNPETHPKSIPDRRANGD
jgi:hypothetical protein